MDNQLDPQAVNLVKAIRQVESGGDFSAKGKSGEFGAYQFMPSTWKGYAKEFGIDVPLEQATREQQNEVAYKKIKAWKDAGHNVGEIASMWNAGEGKKDAYLTGHKGTNKQGVSYDTGAYAKKVATEYQRLKGAIGQGPATEYSNKAIVEGVATPSGNVDRGFMGNLGAGNYGGAALNLVDKGQGLLNSIAKPFVGVAAMPVQALAKAMGQPDPYAGGIGKSLTGKEGLQVSELTPEAKAKDVAKAGAITATAAGAGLLAKGLAYKSALNSPTIKQVLSNYRMPMSEFKSLSKVEQINLLGEAMKGAPMGTAREITKAIEAISGGGLLKRVAKTGISQAKNFALYNLLGDKLGGAVHTITGK